MKPVDDLGHRGHYQGIGTSCQRTNGGRGSARPPSVGGIKISSGGRVRVASTGRATDRGSERSVRNARRRRPERRTVARWMVGAKPPA
jgi:hypothetical protein